MSSNVKIYPGAKIIGKENIVFGNNIIIDDFVFIYARKKITIGNFVHIACFSSIAGGEQIVIGDFVAISHGARVLSGSDDFVNGGLGNSTIPEEYRNTLRAPIKIDNFCMIGANAVVLPGVHIKEGATVGANTVVTRDLEPWGVYLGNKRIKPRNREVVMQNYSRFIGESK